jgi:hypothetical protein
MCHRDTETQRGNTETKIAPYSGVIDPFSVLALCLSVSVAQGHFLLQFTPMRDAKTLLNEQYLEMRWRALSLAADFDRIQRAAGGADVLGNDLRIAKLRRIADLLKGNEPNRAEQVQMLLSDQTPPPK